MNGHSHVIYLGNTTEKVAHKEVPNYYRKSKQLFIDPKLDTDFLHRQSNRVLCRNPNTKIIALHLIRKQDNCKERHGCPLWCEITTETFLERKYNTLQVEPRTYRNCYIRQSQL